MNENARIAVIFSASYLTILRCTRLRMLNSQVSPIDTLGALNGFLPAVKSQISELLRDVCGKYDMPQHVAARVSDYYTRCIDYNIVGGKLARARTVCETLRFARGETDVDPDLFEAASVLGYVYAGPRLYLTL